MIDPSRRILVGAGGVVLSLALLVKHALVAVSPPQTSDLSAGADAECGSGLLASEPPPPVNPDEESSVEHHRGWLVLVWASSALPTPPEKPEQGERAFATLANGALRLARDRQGPVLSTIDLEGCDMHLCATPGGLSSGGGGDDAGEGEGETGWRPKVDHKGAEKRWFKRLPFVLSHPTRPLFRGHRVVWCYALSDAAKEAWAVALHQDIARARVMMDRAVFSAAAAAAAEAAMITGSSKKVSKSTSGSGGGLTRGGSGGSGALSASATEGDPAQRMLIDHLTSCAATRANRGRSRWRDDVAFEEHNTTIQADGGGDAGDSLRKSPEASSVDATAAEKGNTNGAAVSEVGWTSGGAAGAAINALAARILFDMQRSSEKHAEIKWVLGKLVQDIPDLPKFVGPISIDRVCLGKSVPQILAARIPSAAAASAAPWDGGVLANRGPCSALEVEVEFGGVAEITLVTHIDLRAYAEMVAGDEGSGVEASRGDGGSAEGAVAGTGGEGGGVDGGGTDGGGEQSQGGSPRAGGQVNQVKLLTDRFKVLAKKNASRLLGAVAKKLVGVPIAVTIKVKKLSGVLRVWVPPPPGDRLWWGFVSEPEVEMEAIPSMGQLEIRWQQLAEKVSKLITSKLYKELTAALVLPNAANTIIEPLEPFNAIPEMDVGELLEMSRSSFVGEGAAKEEEDNEAETTETAAVTRSATEVAIAEKPEEPKAEGVHTATRVSESAESQPESKGEGHVTFHTPSNSMLLSEDMSDVPFDPGSAAEGDMAVAAAVEDEASLTLDEAEEAVAAIAIAFAGGNAKGDAYLSGASADSSAEKGHGESVTDQKPTDVRIASASERAPEWDWTAFSTSPQDLAASSLRASQDNADKKADRAQGGPPSRILDFHFGNSPGSPATSSSDASGRSTFPLHVHRTSDMGSSGGGMGSSSSSGGGSSSLGLFSSSSLARRAMVAKELAKGKLSKVQATMRSDYEHLTQGLKEGGVKGGLSVAKSIKDRMLKETFTGELAGGSSKAIEGKVYGLGQEIPYAVPADAANATSDTRGVDTGRE